MLYEYDKLYSEERADAWTALPNVTDVDDLEENDDKKDRLLFSAVEVRILLPRTFKGESFDALLLPSHMQVCIVPLILSLNSVAMHYIRN